MSKHLGVVVRGIKAPIIRSNDNIVDFVVNSLLDASNSEGFQLNDGDIVAVTESVVARSQNNYASIDDISNDIKRLFSDDTLGMVFPILSRNRFSMLLRGIARAKKKIVLQLSLPSDEVGNHLLSWDQLDDIDFNPFHDCLNESEFRKYFPDTTHYFTGVDYVEYYRNLIESENCECQIIFSNKVTAILNYCKQVLCCDIHSRNRSANLLRKAGADCVYTLANVLADSSQQHGYNCEYGLLGSNKASDELVKLFPRNGGEVVNSIAKRLFEITNRRLEVMIYGDGAFKDPIGQIWELADPVVSPGFTDGLKGQPNEIKIKYLADTVLNDLSGRDLELKMKEMILNKGQKVINDDSRLGTTPRQLTDLIGSLCDLTSGSGDKGTPIIFIQGYFDNYAKE